MAEAERLEPIAGIPGDVDLAGAFRARGVVVRTGDGVALVAGLEAAAYEGLVRFDSGGLGVAFDLRTDATGVLCLSGAGGVRAGEGVVALGHLPDLPVGPATLGRIVDPLGNPMDGGARFRRSRACPSSVRPRSWWSASPSISHSTPESW